MTARDEWPPTVLLGGSAKAYDELWGEIDLLRAQVQAWKDCPRQIGALRLEVAVLQAEIVRYRMALCDIVECRYPGDTAVIAREALAHE